MEANGRLNPLPMVKAAAVDLMNGGTKYTWTLACDSPDPLTLTATALGVSMSGEVTFTDMDMLQTYARIMSDAWSEHTRLKAVAARLHQSAASVM